MFHFICGLSQRDKPQYVTSIIHLGSYCRSFFSLLIFFCLSIIIWASILAIASVSFSWSASWLSDFIFNYDVV